MAKLNQLTPGDMAPDGTALNIDEQEVSLSSLWSKGPTLLTFLRHFG